MSEINPHYWRKFKQAEKNMLRLFFRRHHRMNRFRYWARQMQKWLDKALEMENES